jgi:hypothetical protein
MRRGEARWFVMDEIEQSIDCNHIPFLTTIMLDRDMAVDVRVWSIKAHLLDGQYEKGVKVSDQQMEALELERHEVCPNWNYKIRPRSIAYAPT